MLCAACHGLRICWGALYACDCHCRRACLPDVWTCTAFWHASSQSAAVCCTVPAESAGQQSSSVSWLWDVGLQQCCTNGVTCLCCYYRRGASRVPQQGRASSFNPRSAPTRPSCKTPPRGCRALQLLIAIVRFTFNQSSALAHGRAV
jgi:hypothetical protein